MKKETYENMMNAINETPALRRYVKFADWTFTKIVYFAYPVLLAYLLIKKEPGFWPALLVPGISFILLSIVRYFINAPRPYEVFEVPSVIERKGSGKSFPSRHVFSVFIIAMTMFWINRPIGLCMFVIGFAIALNRVIGGVHFPRDVIAGILSAVFCGIIGFWVIL